MPPVPFEGFAWASAPGYAAPVSARATLSRDMSEPFGPRVLHRIGRTPLTVAAAWLSPLLILASNCLVAWGRPGAGLASLVIGLMALLWISKQKPRLLPVTVGASLRGLTLDDRHVGRRRIQAALVIPPEKGLPARVRIEGSGRDLPVEIAVADVTEAQAMVCALERDVTQVIATFRAGSAVKASFLRMLATFMVTSTVIMPIIWATPLAGVTTHLPVAPLAAAFAFVALLTIPSHLVVGADGFSLRWLFLRRFVDYADVLGIARSDRGWSVLVRLRSGKTVRIPLDGRGSGLIIEERLREALERFQGDASDDEPRLQRGDRAMRAWTTALRAMGAGADAGPRTAPVPRDRLWRVVEDPQADPRARAAAAVALGGAYADEDRGRLRAVAEATAAPTLRAAIAAAAEDEGDAAITEALAALEEEQARKGA
jgi:hypothetical protein